MRIAYMMSRFPSICETFVVSEMRAVEQCGCEVEVYPLLRFDEGLVHDETRPFVARAHYRPLLDWSIAAANARAFFRMPRRYLGALWEVLRGTARRWDYLAGALVYFPKAVAFAEDMQARGIEHIHCHFSNHPVTVALVIHRLTGIPFSFTVHGHDLHVNPVMLPKKVAAARAAITISEYNRSLIAELCRTNRDNIHLIHCGIDASKFSFVDRSGRTGPLHIVCVGAYLEVKGQIYLIEACRLLKERGLDLRCDLVGYGPDEAKLRRAIKDARLEHEVKLTGALPHNEVARILRQADVAVQPSVWASSGSREGIPVALMEAMATGLPVVASRISGIPELVTDGDSGLLVEPRDPEALASALQALASDPGLRESMGHAAHERVMRDFDLSESARRLIAIFASPKSAEVDVQRAAA